MSACSRKVAWSSRPRAAVYSGLARPLSVSPVVQRQVLLPLLNWQRVLLQPARGPVNGPTAPVGAAALPML